MDDTQILQIHIGKHFRRPRNKKCVKSIVFDLDETIGSFADLNTLWLGLQQIHEPISAAELQPYFNDILDLYPEFLRYGILSIFEYLITKKKQGACDKIYLYTNNHCPPPWISLIVEYIRTKIKTTDAVFDQIISAFKINKKIVELARTTIQKTHSDFIRCTLLPNTTEICFIDNSYHKNMAEDRVYYIQPASYHHGLSYSTIISRFVQSNISSRYSTIFDKKDTNKIAGFFTDWFGEQPGILEKHSIELDILIAHKIMYHIKEFLFYTKRANKTKKRLDRELEYIYTGFQRTRKRVLK